MAATNALHHMMHGIVEERIGKLMGVIVALKNSPFTELNKPALRKVSLALQNTFQLLP